MNEATPNPPIIIASPRLAAYHYYGLGLNITCITGGRLAAQGNPYKTPSHRWRQYTATRQRIEDLDSYSWGDASGVGLVLGYENIRALDFDDCLDSREELIQELLFALGLPLDYEWVTLTHRGFHIILRCKKSSFVDGPYSAFRPSPAFEGMFGSYEIRWCDHLVLPPSLHSQVPVTDFKSYWECRLSSANKINSLRIDYHYVHRSGEFPAGLPIEVEADLLDSLVVKLSGIPSAEETFCVLTGVGSEDADMSYPLSEVCEPSLSDVQDFDISLQLPSTRVAPLKYLFFDTETTGVPKRWDAPLNDLQNWPRVVQLAAVCYNEEGQVEQSLCSVIIPENFEIPEGASRVHGITTAKAISEGIPLRKALLRFSEMAKAAEIIVAHNIDFDEKVLSAEYIRYDMEIPFKNKSRVCTMKSLTDFVGIPGAYGKNKWPTLDELHRQLFSKSFSGAHDALVDVRITAKCFWAAKKHGFF